MKQKLCLLAALILSISLMGCNGVRARVEIRQANEFYGKEQYADALKHYEAARQIDPSFADLDRLIGYSYIGLFKPGEESAQNAGYADRGIEALKRYVKKRPDDTTAREALINLYLNADRTQQAIDYFKEYLASHPADIDTVRSIANLYAKTGDFKESMNWYKKITLLDSNNPEAFYTYGVVLYEKVAKDPPADQTEKAQIIDEGLGALNQALKLKPQYFEALVYLNLMLRQQAQVETDPMKQQDLIKQADEVRAKAIAMAKARSAKK
ncbi:MAG: tetratricopeptide repeat protein [Thermoanaerobaculia bacterium]